MWTEGQRWSKRGNKVNNKKGLWRNGNASDYESEDCRFDPCQARLFDKSYKKHGARSKIKVTHIGSMYISYKYTGMGS